MTKRRTRRTTDEWSALLSEMKTSGQSASAFARERGISMGSLWYWRSKLETNSSAGVSTPKPKPAFAQVVVVPRGRSTSARIEVVTRGGAAIRLEGGFDAALLRDVLQVVESC